MRTERLFTEPETVIDAPLVANIGGGVNSSAMLVEFAERGIIPDLSLFADTGAEKRETYEHIQLLSDWCVAHGLPPIITVSYRGPYGDIEADCLAKGTLPSIVFGYKKCSLKWKRDPQDKHIGQWQPAIDAWAAGKKVIKAIGYDADESHRGQVKEDEKFRYWHPLQEWDFGRNECIRSIERAGLKVPTKSACFFCPSMHPEEIMALPTDLAERAIEIERKAAPNNTTIKGLGRDFAWEDLLRGRISLQQARSAPRAVACECYDGAGLFDEPQTA